MYSKPGFGTADFGCVVRPSGQGYQDGATLPMNLAQVLGHAQASHLRHTDIEHDDQGAPLEYNVERFLARIGNPGSLSGNAEHDGERVSRIDVIVHK